VSALTLDSSVAPTVVDGQALWVRVTFDVNNGSGGRTATFYTSVDGVTWVQLGTPVVSATATSIHPGSAPVTVGSTDVGVSQRLAGRVFSTEVRNGIGGTVVANPDFAAQDAGATSFTDGAGNVWAVASPASIGSVQLSSSFTVTPPIGVAWTHADGDYDIVVGGEVMTVTNVVGTTMTVVRSVNGVVKSHPASSAIALADPSFYAR
jgi:hypothetical protein